MQTNLPLYHRILKQLRQGLPDERVTRQRNMALLMTGLYLSWPVHMALVVRMWCTLKDRGRAGADYVCSALRPDGVFDQAAEQL